VGKGLVIGGVIFSTLILVGVLFLAIVLPLR